MRSPTRVQRTLLSPRLRTSAPAIHAATTEADPGILAAGRTGPVVRQSFTGSSIKVAEARQSAELHQVILDACSDALSNEDNQANCSGFVKTVGDKLGISVGTTGKG